MESKEHVVKRGCLMYGNVREHVEEKHVEEVRRKKRDRGRECGRGKRGGS